MIFKSTHAAKTWDTWVYYHAGTYYLYYMISDQFVCDGFGVATSTDGVSWYDHGWALHPSEQMVRYLGTGYTWKDPDFPRTGRFFCNYSEWRKEDDKQVQHLLFAWSTDLIHWTKFGDELMFKIDERYYKKVEPKAHGPWEDPRWDGMCSVPRPEGGYYGYWTATPKDFLGFGFGESADGIHWQALEPPHIEWAGDPSMFFIEVGGVHQINGRYYAMLADYADIHCGVFSFVADAPQGPFYPSRKNFALIQNQRKMHAYFSRFVDSPDGVLVNHHSIAQGKFSDPTFTVYFAPMKKAEILDGTLYLKWWEGNNKLKKHPIALDVTQPEIRFDPNAGIVLEGVLVSSGSLFISTGNGRATHICVSDNGTVEIGDVELIGDIPKVDSFVCKETIDRETTIAPNKRFRLLLNTTMFEFYLEDYLIQCYTMNEFADGTIFYKNANTLELWQWE